MSTDQRSSLTAAAAARPGALDPASLAAEIRRWGRSWDSRGSASPISIWRRTRRIFSIGCAPDSTARCATCRATAASDRGLRNCAGNGQLHQRAHELLARGGSRRRKRRSPTAARAYVSRYALGRDYHKLMRARLQRLCDRIGERVGPFGHRAFTDSAPVLEKALARNAGLGWIGKHTNLIDRDAGSYFFLGEIYLDLALPRRRAEQRALRLLQRLSCRPAPPARSSPPTASMPAAAFPI